VRFAEGTRIVPELAERWEVDPSGTLFTFKLRRGVLFHEGGGLTAHDVKASFERFLSPALAAPLATMFDAILGAPAFREGNASEVAGIEVPDPGTVRFRLTSPVPFFLSLLTLPDVTVVAPSMMNRKFARLAPQGTGPFALREIHFGKKAIFDRFPGHWDRASIALDGVDLDIAEDSEAGVLQRFLDGQLDVVWDVPYDQAAGLMSDPAYRPYIVPPCSSTRLPRPPLRQVPVRVRRALNHAVDRAAQRQLFAGLAVPQPRSCRRTSSATTPAPAYRRRLAGQALLGGFPRRHAPSRARRMRRIRGPASAVVAFRRGRHHGEGRGAHGRGDHRAASPGGASTSPAHALVHGLPRPGLVLRSRRRVDGLPERPWTAHREGVGDDAERGCVQRARPPDKPCSPYSTAGKLVQRRTLASVPSYALAHSQRSLPE
jgi:hypothetical protein